MRPNYLKTILFLSRRREARVLVPIVWLSMSCLFRCANERSLNLLIRPIGAGLRCRQLARFRTRFVHPGEPAAFEKATASMHGQVE
jgi:hypothetical protein